MSQDIVAGLYKGRAIAGSEQYAINKNGNEQIAIDLDVPALGRAFTTFLHFTDAAAPYAVERLRVCGWTGEDLSNLSGIDANEVDIQVRYEDYKGEKKLKVEIVTGGGRVKLENQMDERQKRAFAARMKSIMKGERAAAAPRTPASPTKPDPFAREAPASNDSDIPF